MTIIIGQDDRECGRITLEGENLSYSGNEEYMAELVRYYQIQYQWTNEQLIEELPKRMTSRAWCKPAA